jgi:glucosyl-3-phosphoglycerate synthase
MDTFHYNDFSETALFEHKKQKSISVCIPAHNEEATIVRVLETVNRLIQNPNPLIDEVIVANDHCMDSTPLIALDYGAKVINVENCIFANGPGKGTAMKAGLSACNGDLVVFLDADVININKYFILGLLGPLLVIPQIKLVKAKYRRSLNGLLGEGGRVTELTAKPLIQSLFPELSWLDQPLSGECAAPKAIFDYIFENAQPGEPWEKYGIEMEILLEVAKHWGADTIAQVDLADRVHRNRSLEELAAIARQVTQVAISKAGINLPQGSF